MEGNCTYKPGLDHFRTSPFWSVEVPRKALTSDEVRGCRGQEQKEDEGTRDVEEGNCTVLVLCEL